MRRVAAFVVLVGLIAGCAERSPNTTVRAYSGTPHQMIVRVVADGETEDWILPGDDDVELVYAGHTEPASINVSFVDPVSCQVVARAGSLLPHSRVGLDFVDPTYAVTDADDDPGSATTVTLARSTACHQGA